MSSGSRSGVQVTGSRYQVFSEGGTHKEMLCLQDQGLGFKVSSESATVPRRMD